MHCFTNPVDLARDIWYSYNVWPEPTEKNGTYDSVDYGKISQIGAKCAT